MKKIFRIIFTLIIIYLTNLSFAFSQNEKIKIGLLAPLSGEYKELGPVSYTHLRAHETQ